MKRILKSLFLALLLCGAVILGEAGKGIYGMPGEEPRESHHVAGRVQGADTEKLALYGLTEFSSTLPVLFLDTRGETVSKENITWGKLGILDGGTGKNDIEDEPQDVLDCTVKLRGASSYFVFDKQQFRVKFYEKKEGRALAFGLAGMAPHSEWVLNGPFLDKTLLRNYLVYGVGREVMDWAPDCRFVEIFVNGDYQGVYLAVEPVTNGGGRLALSNFGLSSGQTGYIVKRDRVGSESETIHTWGELHGYTTNVLSIDYPGRGRLTDMQRQWIIRDISRFEEVLYGEFFADAVRGYAKYIDMDSFVDYYIISEMVMNNDGGNLSTYVYKELGGKLKIALWDYNNSYDNYQWFSTPYDTFFLKENAWFQRLLEDQAFVDRVVGRYRQLREGALSDASMKERLREGREMLGEAVERNFAVWGYTFELSLLAEAEGEAQRDAASYEEAYKGLEESIAKRGAFLDAHITDLYAGCVNGDGLQAK